nr:MAG TPA: hypothetical protein [Caudoviricetes sp.]
MSKSTSFFLTSFPKSQFFFKRVNPLSFLIDNYGIV